MTIISSSGINNFVTIFIYFFFYFISVQNATLLFSLSATSAGFQCTAPDTAGSRYTMCLFLFILFASSLLSDLYAYMCIPFSGVTPTNADSAREALFNSRCRLRYKSVYQRQSRKGHHTISADQFWAHTH